MLKVTGSLQFKKSPVLWLTLLHEKIDDGGAVCGDVDLSGLG